MLDYRYRTFMAVAAERSFTRAAAKLNLSQPAVTQQLRQLQEELGMELFCYQGKQLFLTEKGKYLQQQLFLLNQSIQQVERRLHQTDDALSVTFGSTLSIGEFVVPKVLCSYLQTYPSHHLDMIVSNTAHLIRQIETGRLDFALIEGDFNQNELGYQQFSEEKFIAVCSSQNELWKKERKLPELFSSRLLIREKGSGSRLILENLLQAKGTNLTSFSQRTSIGNIGAIKQLVKADQGISFLYEVGVQEELQDGSLKEIPLHNFAVRHPFHIVYLKQNEAMEEIQNFVQFLK